MIKSKEDSDIFSVTKMYRNVFDFQSNVMSLNKILPLDEKSLESFVVYSSKYY